MNRRTFLMFGAGAVGSSLLRGLSKKAVFAEAETMPFKISLAEWSLVETLHAKKMTNLDFPKVARQEFDIDCIEFVDQFFADRRRTLGI